MEFYDLVTELKYSKFHCDVTAVAPFVRMTGLTKTGTLSNLQWVKMKVSYLE